MTSKTDVRMKQPQKGTGPRPFNTQVERSELQQRERTLGPPTCMFYTHMHLPHMTWILYIIHARTEQNKTMGNEAVAKTPGKKNYKLHFCLNSFRDIKNINIKTYMEKNLFSFHFVHFVVSA